jgi:hypothetical protein
MLSFTNSSNSYDGVDRENRGDHDLILAGYASCVGGSPQARLKNLLGNLMRPMMAGDDAHVQYGRGLAVILHAALPGSGIEAVPFLGNSPKDTALARILEEAVLCVNEEASDLTLTEWAKHCADMRQNTSLSTRSKEALTLNVIDFFSHEVWVPFQPAQGTGPGGTDLPPTTFLREPAAAAMLHLTWAGDLAFASSDSLAPTARLFGYIGGMVTNAQRSAFGQADITLSDLFAKLTQGDNPKPEEAAIEIAEGWRNSQWPDCMITLPSLGPASAVDMKRMLDYAINANWPNFKTKAIAAAASTPEMRALFARETNPANVEATLMQLAPPAKVSAALPPHTILEAVRRLCRSHLGWLTRSDVSAWPTDAIAAALLERLHGAGLATSQAGSQHAGDDGGKQNAAGYGGKGGIAPSMTQRWLTCAASKEHNTQVPLLEEYLLRTDHDPVTALEMAFSGQYPVELLAECDTTTSAGKAKHAAMLAHNTVRTPLCILHQICWGVVRAVIVLPTLNLLEQYATTHRSKMWGRVIARVYALDDGMPPKALRNLDLLALDKALAGKIGQAIDLTNMVDAVVVSIYNGVSVQPIPTHDVYSDLIHLNRIGGIANAIFRTLRMDARGKEFSSALNMPNAFAALHANITADGSRGVERSNQQFVVGILNEAWQAYTLVRDGMDPGGALPREVVRPGSAAMRLIADIYNTFNTRAETRRAEGTEMGLRCIELPRSRPAGETLTGDNKRLRTGLPGGPLDPATAGAQFMDSLGNAPPKLPPKLHYTHPATGKKYSRAVFAAAAMAHNGCMQPCCAKWIDPASPCPMEGQPGHCNGDPSHSMPRQWDASKALVQ